MTWLSLANGFSAPLTVAELELAGPSVTVPSRLYGEPASLPPLSGAPEGAATDDSSARHALILVRLHARPIGTILVEQAGTQLDAAECARQAREALQPEISAHQQADGLAKPADPAPPVSVVVATRERQHMLAACLDSLAQLDYPDYEIIVVDNDPETTRTAELVRARSDPRIHYVVERRRGLAAAHNRGVAQAGGSIVAFTDDDVLVDKHWLSAISSAMRSAPGIACVTGLIMPAELVTQAQLMLEFHGNFAKGFDSLVVDMRSRRPPDPLFPFTVGKLGSGANMAFGKDVLRSIGGFDPAIGTGTRARGGDDLAALFDVLATGAGIAYEPSALVWHRHRRDLESLSAQAYGYGVGLSAYLASALAAHPRMIGRAMLRAPAGLAYALRTGSQRTEHVGPSWPRELVWLERKGMAWGPFAYGASRWRSKGASRPRPGAARSDVPWPDAGPAPDAGCDAA